MPVKNWTDGDFVYGVDMDFLTSSVVMRFADATARTAALVGDLAPVVGMVSFLADTQTWWTYVSVSATTGAPVTSGGTGFWVPLPGTPIVNAYATAAQTLANSNQPYALACSTATRNLNTWYSTSTYKLTPKAPGWYQVSAGTTFVLNGNNSRQIWIRTNAGDVPGSGTYNSSPSAGAATSVTSRTVAVRMNGSTDWIDAAILQNTGGSLDTYVALGYHASNFNVTYLGVA